MLAIPKCVIVLLLSVAPVVPPEPPDDVASLAWLGGSWTGVDGEVATEETWLEPKGGAMLGVHRDVSGDKMVGFEFLLIATRGEKIAYLASVNGKAPVVFPLKELTDRRVVFENLNHDYPQRVVYWLDKDGALHAGIEGDRDGKKPSKHWTWRRVEAAASRPR